MATIDIHLDIIAKAMSLRLNRQAAITGNIANADTPGFRPKQVAFEAELQKAAEKNSVRSLDGVKSKMETIDDNLPRVDGNSVNLDKQMAMLAENGLLYNASAEFIARKMRMLKSVIG